MRADVLRSLALACVVGAAAAMPMQPQAAQPQTAQPQTAQPQTAQPQTAQASRGAPTEFRPGDRIVLTVEDEPTLTDTFTVAAGPSLRLPLVGEVSLAGVRREALTDHLTQAISRVIRQPVVTTQTLVRIAVLGEVARPGYFVVPTDALLSDAITLAGGFTGEAEMRRLTLSRQGQLLQKDGELHRSIAEGRTIDDIGIAAGDELMVPRRHDTERTARILGLLVSIPLTVYFLTRI